MVPLLGQTPIMLQYICQGAPQCIAVEFVTAGEMRTLVTSCGFCGSMLRILELNKYKMNYIFVKVYTEDT